MNETGNEEGSNHGRQEETHKRAGAASAKTYNIPKR